MDGESRDTEVEIIGEFLPAKGGKSLRDRWRQFLTNRKVKVDPIQEPVQEVGKDDFASTINIIEEDVGQQSSREEITIDLEMTSKIYVSEGTNQTSAMEFVRSLRGITEELLGENSSGRSYVHNEDYAALDLLNLAHRWSLPVVLLRRGEDVKFGHWVLGLAQPQRFNDSWRILVYDPLRNGEDWQELRDWRGFEDEGSLSVNQIFASEHGWQALRKNSYNLSLRGDSELADQIVKAKEARFQFNVVDCGPLCLYAAALRQGVKPDQNEFKVSGREKLESDTGLKVLTREELV